MHTVRVDLRAKGRSASSDRCPSPEAMMRCLYRVGDDEFYFASGQRAVLLLQERRDPLLHLVAALRERPSLDGQETDFERGVLCDGRSERVSRVISHGRTECD